METELQDALDALGEAEAMGWLFTPVVCKGFAALIGQRDDAVRRVNERTAVLQAAELKLLQTAAALVEIEQWARTLGEIPSPFPERARELLRSVGG